MVSRHGLMQNDILVVGFSCLLIWMSLLSHSSQQRSVFVRFCQANYVVRIKNCPWGYSIQFGYILATRELF